MFIFVTASIFCLVTLDVVDAARVQTHSHISKSDTGSLPNPPLWPPSVHVIGPADQHINEHIRDATTCLTDRVCGHWSNQRIAFLFKPGTYHNLNINVGYYMQILGLGERADDVIFRGGRGVYSPAMDQRWHHNGFSAGSLDCFWRGAENFKQEGSLMWAVSQAAPMRRIHVTGDLLLHDAGRRASGGYFADTQVDGQTMLGSQQQWFMRSSNIRTSNPATMGGVWNIVLVGVQGGPKSIYPRADQQTKAISNIPKAPVVAEKPHITIDGQGRYYLQVPPIRRGSAGAHLNDAPSAGRTRTIPFEKVFVACAEWHNADAIQDNLDRGFSVVLAPGIFNLEHSLTLRHEDQVLLGIGMATVMSPTNGDPCIKVASNTPGVRVAGVMLGARGKVKALLEWGDEGVKDDASKENPGVMTDIFARVGGPDQDRHVRADFIVRVHSDYIIGDNLWLWRADHAKLGRDDPDMNTRLARGRPECVEYHCVEDGEYNARTGLEVHGNHVIMYGLFVEHTTGDMTVWHGEHGRVYFYQSELPYDGCHPESSGYVVQPHVNNHEAHGVGVYTFFRDRDCIVRSAFRVPEHKGIHLYNAFSRFLNGKGGIGSVMNRLGERKGKKTITKLHTMHRVPEFHGQESHDGSSGRTDSRGSSGKCKVGELVKCPNSNRNQCSGNQCCSDGSVCPSADPNWNWCTKPKGHNCL